MIEKLKEQYKQYINCYINNSDKSVDFLHENYFNIFTKEEFLLSVHNLLETYKSMNMSFESFDIEEKSEPYTFENVSYVNIIQKANLKLEFKEYNELTDLEKKLINLKLEEQGATITKFENDFIYFDVIEKCVASCDDDTNWKFTKVLNIHKKILPEEVIKHFNL
jgi:hypothetical protein